MSPSYQLIKMSNVPGSPKLRALTHPLVCKMWNGEDEIPIGFVWDGASTPWFALPFFPRHDHPLASCKHDYRCLKARNDAERKWADIEFRKDVDRTSWKITSKMGYYGVRVGALLGIGSSF